MGTQRDFWIAHQSKLPGTTSPQVACFTETCQRRLWLGVGLLPTGLLQLPELEVYWGREAYTFLLRIATGLESELAGETDVFGQVKAAWKLFESQNQDLRPIFNALFEDTKEIRTLHLNNIGGSSYGSIARKLLNQISPEPWGDLLILGAGQIARSTAPLLHHGRTVWISNRTLSTAQAFAEDLRTRHRAQVRVCESPEQELTAWRRAQHVLVCVPVDPLRDVERVQLWNQTVSTTHSFGPKSLLHLGALRHELGPWTGAQGLFDLNHLFELQAVQNELRSAQLHCAAKACTEKALLRELSEQSGGSISLPHGWEDLALFA